MVITKVKNDAKDAVVEWIDHILERKQWNGTELAKHCDIAASTILRLLNNPGHKFTPSMKTMNKIAVGSGYPIPRSVMLALGAAKSEFPEEGPNPRTPINAASIARARPMVEVRHVSSLPASLHAAERREIKIAAPAQLEGDDTAFAFYMPDSVLEPWIKAGSLMYATKRRDPIAGDIVLVSDKEGRSRVRLMLQIDESGISLSQSMPAKEDEKIGFDELGDIAVVAIVNKI